MNQEKVKMDQITDHITGKPGEDVLEPRSASGTGAQPISSGRRKFFRQVGTASLGITAGMVGMHRLVSAASEHALGDISGLGGEHEPGDSTGPASLRRRRRYLIFKDAPSVRQGTKALVVDEYGGKRTWRAFPYDCRQHLSSTK